LLNLLLGFGPVILLVGLFVFLARRAGGAGAMGALGNFSRARARRSEGEQRVTFDDVAGIDEAKAELTEIVDFLKNPERYSRLGGRIPRGVLLSGLPGTGKTLLAKAVAGQAGAPFFSISASEFVEAIVGIGASRVRDLFRQAKEAAPAIIFIDELDAIGRSRSSGVGFGGGNDEREQTLNQILTEMDGFDSDTAVIVLGATNRPEILDPALLRPGRFDRRVVVPPPDKEGRRKILEVHTRSLPLAPDVNLDRLAATTPGMVGADLANLANEAALTAARRQHEQVEMADFTDALEKIVLGAPRGTVLSAADRRRVAYHEAGHALVGMLTEGADPVRKVSIIPRGMALGVTLSAPELDKANYEQSYLMSKIHVALGGRVAEEIVFGSITTGAESDIEQLTGIARAMVGRWGMSPAIGPIAVLPSEARGPMLPGAAETSPETQRLIDQEVQRIVADAHRAVTELLTEQRAKLDSLTEALLATETLDEDAAYAAAGVPRVPDSSSAPPALVAMDDRESR
ncbi:MAG TPA: ATP-dependent zinc metalloprotease FtsH, partial [Solirubrobacteraceae bacterium]|nr:ATP-dependent zinc metalloprotease FtsH [Solirubrobacteraceae bacterium]